MVDFAAWAEVSRQYAGRPFHAHNRLIASVTTPPEERRRLAHMICHKLSLATGPVTVVLPLQGVEEWDRPGEPLHDAEGLAAFADALRISLHAPITLIEGDGHINDDVFAQAVLDVLYGWIASGVVPPGARACA